MNQIHLDLDQLPLTAVAAEHIFFSERKNTNPELELKPQWHVSNWIAFAVVSEPLPPVSSACTQHLFFP